MVFFRSKKAAVGKMRAAEAKMIELAKEFGDQTSDAYTMELQDTPIPRNVLPLKKEPKFDEVVIHGVHLHSPPSSSGAHHGQQQKKKTPLVLLHGYMNGSLYFYRNLVGLTHYFESIHSLDLLGFGLSSRPNYSLADSSVGCTEAFFVESLEAWRKAQNIDKMILAGHSLGGYLGVAYCEKYPQHVEQLLMLSPAGVSRQTEDFQERLTQMPLSRRLVIKGMKRLCKSGTTPGTIMRSLPKARGRGVIENYVKSRLPVISNPKEQEAVADYLYSNAILPGSGEHCLPRLMHPEAYARSPTVDRIPYLKVPKISFLYGEHDWMDIESGMEVGEQSNEFLQKGSTAPLVDVYQVKNAGHLLMLENWREFNAGIIQACGGAHTLAPQSSLPRHVQKPTTTRRSSPHVDASDTARQWSPNHVHAGFQIAA